MKKLLTKLCTVLLCVLLSLASFAGCAGGGLFSDGGIEVDDSKTQLYCCYFNSGYGSRWLTAAGKRFEEMYKDYSFEEGKVGVQVIPDPSSENDMSQNMSSMRSHVYFSEMFRLDDSASVVEDLTTALTTPLNESYGVDVTGKALPGYAGETKSVYDKFSDEDKNNYARGGVIYAVPYIDTYTGTLTYNADIFEQYSLYYNSNNQLGATSTDALGLGPDGYAGTADDGLPRTYDEFFALCDKMVEENVIPFTWAGNYNQYVSEFGASLSASNMGLAQMKDFLAGQGTINDYIESVDEEGNYTKQTKSFTRDNVKDIYKTASIYNAVNFIYRMYENTNYYVGKSVFTGSYMHTKAQSDFFKGSEVNNDDYGFLVDGTWWYNEAESAIESYESYTGNSRYDRDVRYMPLPKANLEEWESNKGNLVFADYQTAMMVKKGLSPELKLLAETFVRFFCTDESLAEYNTIVSCPRRLEYDLSADQYATLSPYAKTLYNIHTSNEEEGYQYYTVFRAMSSGDFYRSGPDRFKKELLYSKTDKAGDPKVIIQAFKNSGVTVLDYYNGVYKYHS